MAFFPHSRIRFAAVLGCVLAAVSGCSRDDDGEVVVGIVSSAESLYASGLRLSPAAQTYRAAIADGLVGLDENASAIPALAESWIVTDDGRSYIFRLRRGEWRGGEEISARSVAAALERRTIALAGTTLGRDLAIVDDVRAMAGRVIEIRLKAPMPQFLALLAQPELALADGPTPRGRMEVERSGQQAVLTPTSPDLLGLPVPRRWEDSVRPVRVVPVTAAEGVDLFAEGALDVMLGGTIASYPLAPSGTLTRGTIRVDAAQGLFGLRVMSERGFLALPQGREAVSMAIDREGLMESFNISGWVPRTTPVPQDLSSLDAEQRPSWLPMSLEERRDLARSRASQWRSRNGGAPMSFRISLPRGPGADRIMNALAGDLTSIGIALRRVGPGEPADLVLVDRVARYPAARWYLNQLSCGASKGACSALADSLVDEALEAGNAAEYARLMKDAEAELTNTEAFINFGQPLRWSLARGSVSGIAPNAAGYHPLPPLGVVPN